MTGTAVNDVKPSAVSAGTPQERPPSRFRLGLRIVDGSSGPLYRTALVSLAVTCVLAAAIAWSIRPAGPLAGPQQDMVYGSRPACA